MYVCVVRAFRSRSTRKLQEHKTGWFTVATIPSIRTYTRWPMSPCCTPPPTASDNDQTLCFCEFDFFRFHVQPCSTFLLRQRLIMGQLKPKHEYDNSPKHHRLTLDRNHHCHGRRSCPGSPHCLRPMQRGQTDGGSQTHYSWGSHGRLREHVIWGDSWKFSKKPKDIDKGRGCA